MAPAALSPARPPPPPRTAQGREAGLSRKRKRCPEPRRKRRLSGETERGGAGMWRLLLALAGLGGALAAGAVTELNAAGTPPAAAVGSAQVGSGEAVRYRTAEMADAMLGSGLPAQQAVGLSVVPGEAREEQESTAATTGTCEAAAGGSGECGAGSRPSAPLAQPDTQGREHAAGSPVVLETVLPGTAEEPNGTESVKTPKVACEERNVTGISNFTLQILNVSQDLMEFLNPNSSDCTLVLFYTPWCRFSVSLAPHFNSLPRAFPTLRFLALDASQHSSLSTRFGTVAVPNILLFQGAKPMARFNHTDRTLETLKDFIFNQTGIEAKSDVTVTEEDWAGPLPSVLTKGIDWLLLFSLLFLASFIMYATIRTESIRWLIPGQEHEHQE
ncbi:thioredoxin domain-containing protein 15 [Anser cygnoides]|uniref:thioredoxin domain-containing protein 15 n=1 Tax=Anser cygnoides TaxID=8845 RepID=UPI0034D30F62